MCNFSIRSHFLFSEVSLFLIFQRSLISSSISLVIPGFLPRFCRFFKRTSWLLPSMTSILHSHFHRPFLPPVFHLIVPLPSFPWFDRCSIFLLSLHRLFGTSIWLDILPLGVSDRCCSLRKGMFCNWVCYFCTFHSWRWNLIAASISPGLFHVFISRFAWCLNSILQMTIWYISVNRITSSTFSFLSPRLWILTVFPFPSFSTFALKSPVIYIISSLIVFQAFYTVSDRIL